MAMNPKNIFYKIFNYLHKLYSFRSEKKYIKGLMSTCPEIKTLSKEQKRSIQAWYKSHYGKKLPDYRWHAYYYTRNGVFSEKYIPNYVLSDINKALYDPHIAAAFDDKNLYDTLFPDVLQPKTYVKCINGFYYDKNGPITRTEAISRCTDIGKVIIKPTYRSQNGRGVKHLELRNGRDERSKDSVSDVFDNYGKNFIVQESIRQHERLSALCPTSVNTIRIVTYRRSESEVVVIYHVMRIGKFGSEVDNTSAGGMTCKIEENGRLSKYAICSKPAGKFEQNEAGVVFENYQVPSFGEVVAKAKEMHLRLPHFIMIGWDFSVNEDGNVVFVEMNAPFGLHQPAAGPGYGKYTEEIFERCFGKPKC